MRETLVATCEVENEEGAKRRFDYYLLVGEVGVREGFACESYGVKVSDGADAAEFPNITTSASRIDELLELLERGTVGPAGLRDVLEDWL